MEWTNRGKFNGVANHDIFVRKGVCVWDTKRMVPYKRNSNGVVHAVFPKDDEVLVRWYDMDKDRFQLYDVNEFFGRWTDKYGGGYWLDDATAPNR